MRALLPLFLCVMAAGPAPSADPAKSWAVPGLELSEPTSRDRPGLVKVVAKVTAPKEAKVEIVWDCESAFQEDPDLVAEYEVREDGRTVQVVIPDATGVVKITAVAVIDGKATRFCKTWIDTSYVPRKKKEEPQAVAPPTPKEAPKERAKEQKKDKSAQLRGKVTDCFVCLGAEDDPDVAARFGSTGFRNKLARAGVVGTVLSAEQIDARKVRQYVQDAGGTPCVLFLVGDEKELKVRSARRLTKEDTADGVVAEASGE